MGAAIGVGSTVDEATQVEGRQLGDRVGGSAQIDVDPVHVRTGVHQYQVGVADGFSHPRRSTARDVDPINIGVRTRIADVKIAVLRKADVLAGRAKVGGTAITSDQSCRPGGGIDCIQFTRRGSEQRSIAGPEGQ